MRICIITLFPKMFAALEQGILGRAQKRGLMELITLNLRDFAENNNYHSLDDKPYGGGPGQVIKVAPLQAAIRAARQLVGSVVSYLSPQGTRFDQQAAIQLSQRNYLILIAGRYEGVDERLIQTEVQEEWSIGDFILSGGELAIMCLIDAVVRLLPGALGDATSVIQESFTDALLDYPHYTRPETIDGQRVPTVLLSGDHQAIARWRLKQALGRTWQRRPDLLCRRILSHQEQVLLREYIHENA